MINLLNKRRLTRAGCTKIFNSGKLWKNGSGTGVAKTIKYPKERPKICGEMKLLTFFAFMSSITRGKKKQKKNKKQNKETYTNI